MVIFALVTMTKTEFSILSYTSPPTVIVRQHKFKQTFTIVSFCQNTATIINNITTFIVIFRFY